MHHTQKYSISLSSYALTIELYTYLFELIELRSFWVPFCGKTTSLQSSMKGLSVLRPLSCSYTVVDTARMCTCINVYSGFDIRI